MRKRKQSKTSHDYTAKPQVEEVEGEEEERIVPIRERKMPFFVSYTLPGDQTYVTPEELALFLREERVEATSVKEAEQLLKRLQPTAEHIVASPVCIVLYSRPKGTKKKFELAGFTMLTATQSFAKELETLEQLQNDYTSNPMLLYGVSDSPVPEFKRVEYHNVGAAPEEID